MQEVEEMGQGVTVGFQMQCTCDGRDDLVWVL